MVKKYSKCKIPTHIGNTEVYADDSWVFKREGKPDEKMISLRASDPDDYSLWEMFESNGKILHMLDRDGNQI